MKKVSERELIDWWLTKYHDTTLEQVEKDHPEWMEKPQEHTRDFYTKYAVTEEQHDEWVKWAKEHLRKATKMPKKYIERSWGFVYLNTAPSILK